MPIKYPDIIEPSNQSSTGYPIVRGTNIGGQFTVAEPSDLCSIYDYILSPSGNNTGNDAIGFTVYVRSEGKHYTLTDWSNRNTMDGWSYTNPASDWDKDGDVYPDGIKHRTHYEYTEETEVEYEYTSLEWTNISLVYLPNSLMDNINQEGYQGDVKRWPVYDKVIIDNKEFIYTDKGGDGVSGFGASYYAEDNSYIMLWASCYANLSNSGLNITVGDDVVFTCVNIETTPRVQQLNEKFIPSTITRNSELATVARTGSYNDLLGKPEFDAYTDNEIQELWDNA